MDGARPGSRSSGREGCLARMADSLGIVGNQRCVFSLSMLLFPIFVAGLDPDATAYRNVVLVEIRTSDEAAGSGRRVHVLLQRVGGQSRECTAARLALVPVRERSRLDRPFRNIPWTPYRWSPGRPVHGPPKDPNPADPGHSCSIAAWTVSADAGIAKSRHPYRSVGVMALIFGKLREGFALEADRAGQLGGRAADTGPAADLAAKDALLAFPGNGLAQAIELAVGEGALHAVFVAGGAFDPLSISKLYWVITLLLTLLL